MDELHKKIDDHIQDDKTMFFRMMEKIESIFESIYTIESNHLAHMEADLVWMKWITLAILGGMIATYFKK